TLLRLQTKFTHGQPGSEDNEWNTQVDMASQSHPGPSATRQPDETIPLQEKECLIPIEEERRKLVPANGEGPRRRLAWMELAEQVRILKLTRQELQEECQKQQIDALRRSFLRIAEDVPLYKWHSYMIVLGLTDSEIEIAEANARGNVVEQHFQMLRTWQEKNGTKASLDTLLKTLCDPAVNLKGVERKIREALISMDLYTYED
ncbi:UNVERIFIED_CONTAM: hypothetical protein K2H54_034512, partial [Gekko kuhli]